MRVLMIRPRERARYPRFLSRIFRMYEIGPLMVATALQDRADVLFIDENFYALPSSLDFDLVLITVQTHLAPRAYELADQYRRAGTLVVLGGPHVTLCPGESSLHADAIVIGPGEEAILRVFDDIKMHRLQRVYNGMQWHSRIGPADHRLVGPKALLELRPVMMTRGCQHRCSYCAITHMNRGRVSERCADEIISDIDRAGARGFYFVDDNLLARRKLLVEVLSRLASRRRPTRWAGQITWDVIRDGELMQLMQASGCRILYIGFESLRGDSLRQIGIFKSLAHDILHETVERLHNVNVSVMGSFIFGFDADVPGDVLATTEASIQSGLDVAALNILTPIPGTPLYDEHSSEGRIFEHDLSRYDFKNIVFYPKNFSPAELQQEFEEATKMFYSAEGLIRRLGRMRNKWLMLPLNILYNAGVKRLLRLDWRHAHPRRLDGAAVASHCSSSLLPDNGGRGPSGRA